MLQDVLDGFMHPVEIDHLIEKADLRFKCQTASSFAESDALLSPYIVFNPLIMNGYRRLYITEAKVIPACTHLTLPRFPTLCDEPHHKRRSGILMAPVCLAPDIADESLVACQAPAGDGLHHTVEIETAGFLARWKFAETL